MGERFEQALLQKDIKMTNKHGKRCSISLDIREMEIKTLLRYHYTPIVWLK